MTEQPAKTLAELRPKGRVMEPSDFVEKARLVAVVQDYGLWIAEGDRCAAAFLTWDDVTVPTPGDVMDRHDEFDTIEEAKFHVYTTITQYMERRTEIELSDGMQIMMEDFAVDDADVKRLFEWADRNQIGYEEVDNDFWLPIWRFENRTDADLFAKDWPQRRDFTLIKFRPIPAENSPKGGDRP